MLSLTLVLMEIVLKYTNYIIVVYFSNPLRGADVLISVLYTIWMLKFIHHFKACQHINMKTYQCVNIDLRTEAQSVKVILV
jgi:hypothetical protein